MPKTKALATEKSKKVSSEEKIVNVDELDEAPEIEEKPETLAPLIEDDEEDMGDDDAILDSEEIDPFGDTWEQ